MTVDILNLCEVATYLHVHESTLRRLLRRRELPAFKVGRDWRFTKQDIDAWRLSRPQATAATYIREKA